jgi:nitrate reductase NapE component
LTFLSREDTNSQASARKASLQPIEAQIKQIQKMISTVQREDQWFANQQLAMKERNDNLSFSVMVLNLLLVLVVVVGYFGQMWYLKQYLVSKRVIY